MAASTGAVISGDVAVSVASDAEVGVCASVLAGVVSIAGVTVSVTRPGEGACPAFTAVVEGSGCVAAFMQPARRIAKASVTARQR